MDGHAHHEAELSSMEIIAIPSLHGNITAIATVKPQQTKFGGHQMCSTASCSSSAAGKYPTTAIPMPRATTARMPEECSISSAVMKAP